MAPVLNLLPNSEDETLELALGGVQPISFKLVNNHQIRTQTLNIGDNGLTSTLCGNFLFFFILNITFRYLYSADLLRKSKKCHINIWYLYFFISSRSKTSKLTAHCRSQPKIPHPATWLVHMIRADRNSLEIYTFHTCSKILNNFTRHTYANQKMSILRLFRSDFIILCCIFNYIFEPTF